MGGGSRPNAIGLDMCPGGNVETRIARDPGMPGMLPVRDGHFHDHQGVTAARVRGHRIGAAQCVSC